MSNGSGKLTEVRPALVRPASEPNRNALPGLSVTESGYHLSYDALAEGLGERFTVLHQVSATEKSCFWLAEESAQGRIVMLEVLAENLAAEDLQVDFFYQEAAAAARLHHPHILRAEPAEPVATTHFRVLEYIRGGETLHDLLAQRGWLEPRQAVRIAVQVSNALNYAHQCGVWHLRLQPTDIWLDTNGEVVIGGFGVASEPDLNWTWRLRAVGCVPSYLSPEQVAGMYGDRRSDLYALGVLLYEMLTDRVPFDSNDLNYLRERQKVQLPQPPQNFRPELPTELSSLVMRLLTRNPDLRARQFGNAEGFGAALRQACDAPAGRSLAAAARPTSPLPLQELSEELVAAASVAPAEAMLARRRWNADAQVETRTRPWLAPVTQGLSAGTRWTLAALVLMLPLGWWMWQNVLPMTSTESVRTEQAGGLPARQSEGEAEPPALNHVVTAPAGRPASRRDPRGNPNPAAANNSEKKTASPAETSAAAPGPNTPEDSAPDATPQTVPPLSRPRTVAEVNQALAAGQAQFKLPSSVPGNSESEALPAPQQAPNSRANNKPARVNNPVKFGEPIKRSGTRFSTSGRGAPQGIVSVRVTVNERGNVTSAQAIAGPKALHARAQAAARQWKFQPSTRNGVPVQVVRQINFDFRPAPPRNRQR
jgi:eukaryotic-like serine/threonine-protein kinase